MSIENEKERYNELVVIDSNIEDVSTILSSLADDQLAFLLSDGTGIDELLSYLKRSGITWNAMHFITHGRDGSFSLNGDTISLQSLDSEKWAQLGTYLTDDGDILLYACNVTASDDGKKLIETLSAITGADVAASNDITGIGGDWELETTTGGIEARNIALSHYGNALYTGRLVINSGTSKEITNETFNGNIINEPYPYEKGACGGAINNAGTFTANKNTYSGNTAYSAYGSAYGGAVYNTGTFSANSNTFSRNLATTSSGKIAYGGAVYNTGIFFATCSSFDGNAVSGGYALCAGGAVYNTGTFTAVSCSFCENKSNVWESGIQPSGTASGGAIYNRGSFIVEKCYFSGNEAIKHYNHNGYDIIISISGAIQNDGVIFISGSTFSRNRAVFENTGTAAITDSAFSNNTNCISMGRGTISIDENFFLENNRVYDGTGNATFNGNTFSGNTNCINIEGTCSLFNNLFIGNTSSQRGCILNRNLSTASGNTFRGNKGNSSIQNSFQNSTETVVFIAENNLFNDNIVAIRNYGTFTANSNTFSGNHATKGGAIFQSGTNALLILRDSSFLTETDTIYIEDGNVTFGGNISLAGNLYSKNAITVENGTKITLDLSSYTEANTVEIITNLDSILNTSSSATYQVKLNDNQAQGKYLLATGATARTISVVSDKGTLVQTMSVGDAVLNPNNPTEIFWYTLDSKGNLCFEVMTKKDPPIITVETTPTGWTNQDVSVTATYTDQSETGLKYTQYSLDNSVWKDYTGTFTIDKNQTVYFRTEDKLGNKATKDITIDNIDKIKPTISATKSTELWTNKDVTLTATFADEGGSQLKDKQYSYDQKTWTDYTTELVIDAKKTVFFKATDNAGNETIEFVDVRNIDKVMPTIIVFSSATTWTKDPITLTATFADEGGSRLKSQWYSLDNETWLAYEEPLTIEENGDVYFKADDNAGNISTKKITVDRIEQSGPVITVTQDPEEWTEESVTLSATFEDKQSGVAKREYKIGDGDWLEYTDGSQIVRSENGFVYFRGTDNIGNVTVKAYEIHTIMAPEPTPSVVIPAGGTQTITKSLYDVKNFDIKKGTTVIAEGLQMQDGNAKLTIADDSSLNVAEILPGDGGSKTTVTLKNGISLIVRNDTLSIENFTTGKNAVVRINGEYTGATEKSKLSFGTCSTVTVAKGVSSINKLTLGNGTAANIKKGLLEQHSVFEANEISGSSFGDTLTFGNYAEVRIAKDIILDDGGSDTVKIGNYSEFNAKDIKFSGNTASKNTFNLGTASMATVNNILNMNKLTLSNGTYDKTTGITDYTELTAATITGSTFGDTLTFGNYNDVKLTGDIDLSADGSDTVKIGNYCEFEAQNILFNDKAKSKNTFSLGTASTAKINNILNVNKLTLSNGVYDKNTGKTSYTELTAATITGSTFGDTLTFGNYSKVEIVGNVDLSENGSDTVKIGNYSKFTAQDILFSDTEKCKNAFSIGTASLVTVQKIANVNKLTLSNGIATNIKKGIVQQFTTLKATSITGSDYGDTLSFGNDTKVEITGKIALEDGNDTLKIGKNSVADFADINFGDGDAKSKDAMSVGTLSEVKTGNITGINKLTVTAGTSPTSKQEAEYTELTVGTISGTLGNDTLSLGNYTKVITKDIDFKEGDKDTLTVGTGALVEIRGAMTGLAKTTIGKNATVVASDDTIEAIQECAGKKGIGSGVKFISLGDDTAASAFKGVDVENADNTVDDARDIISMTGWLSDADAVYCDEVDFFTLGELTITDLKGKSITGENINVEVLGKNGNVFETIADAVTQTGDTWTFNDIAATYADYRIKVSLGDASNKAISYEIKLA